MADPVLPVAVDALVHLWGAAPEIDCKVFDGPEAQWPDFIDLIAVGLSPENLANPAQREPAGLASTREQADITCVARSWSKTDKKIKPRRDRAYGLFKAAAAVVEAHRNLGGAVSSAQVVSSIYIPSRPPQGLVVDVVFTVRVRRF